jgi:hypothetical protein
MDETQRLKLPLILAAQAQKHVTHNEALRALDCIVQLSVLDRDLTAPPTTPAEGDRYIVATSPTGTWTGHGGDVAAWQGGAWGFYAPQPGWIAWVADEDSLLAWDGASWVVAGGGVNPTPLVGVNATADSTNRLSIKSAASLFDNDGNGHQHKINKAAAGDTASLLFQTGYSGRAEIGTAGDEKLHVKVSPDGSSWKEAMVVDPATGFVGIGTNAPQSRLHIFRTTELPIHERVDDAVPGPVSESRKARGSVSAKTAVLSGDVIQGFFGSGYDGTAYVGCGNLRWVVDGSVSTGIIPTRVEFFTSNSSGVLAAKLEVKSDGTARPVTDNAYSFGDGSHRWTTIYAATGSINTSDERDKDAIGGLSFAGAMVDSVDPLLFRFKIGGKYLERDGEEPDPEEPGKMRPRIVEREKPGVRAHAGWLAQDIKAAMEAAGVDFGAWGLEDAGDADSRQWVRPDQLCAVLWAALKETRAEVAALKAASGVAGVA